MIKKILLVSLILAVSTVHADDLLDILEGSKTTTNELATETNALTSAITKEIGKTNNEQNIFLDFLAKENYQKALYQWFTAFRDSHFSRSSTGKALFAYLLFKNGLEINGIEYLFEINNPKSINRELALVWRLVAPAEHPTWGLADIKWNSTWTRVFGSDTAINVLSRQKLDLKDKDNILSLLKRSKLKTNARHWLEWQMALSLAVNNEVGKSAKVLAHLLKSKQEQVDHNLITITAARLLYGQGYLDAAAKYYKRVEKKSEYWFTAQEELAWTYIRKGEPQNTLAVGKSLVIPEFTAHVGPEMLFLQSIAQLKVCDYPGVAKSITSFKKRFKSKSQALIEIESKGLTEETKALISALKDGEITLIELGPAALKLPRYVSRDKVLYGMVQRQVGLMAEAKKASHIYSQSLTGGTGQVGFQADFEYLNKNLQARAQAAKNASINTIKLRAREELKEVERILQKMHIVEAELIQQISTATRTISETKDMNLQKQKSNLQANKYDLKFPFVGEKWFDEISHYSVDVAKGCQAKGVN